MPLARSRSSQPLTKRTAGSWRAKRRDRQPAKRRARRIVATLVALALLAWFAYLLLDPLRRPKAILVLAWPESTAATSSDAPPFRERNAQALADAIGPQLLEAPSEFHGEGTPADLFGSRLRTIAPDSDVLLLYVQAHAAVDGDRAVLVWGREPGETEAQSYPVRDLLAGLAGHPAPSKVLLLDAGNHGPDRRSELLADAFTTRLIEDCRAADDSICVLVSRDDRQRSHLSESLDRSVFGYAIERGLAGSADRNRDGYIRLSELHDYVAAAVATWVRETTGGREAQVPQLIACGTAADPANDPLLLPAPRWFRRTSDAAAWQKALAKANEDRQLANAPPGTSDRTSEAAGIASAATSKPGNNAATPANDTQTAGANPSGANPDGIASNTTGLAGAPTTLPGAAATTAEPAADPTVSVTASTSAPTASELIAAGWALRDALEGGTTQRSDPRQNVPHLWRWYLRRLAELENTWNTGSKAERLSVTRELRRLIPPLQRWAAGGSAETDVDEPVRLLMTDVRHRTVAPPGSLGLAESMAQAGGTPAPADVVALGEAFDRQVTSGDREAMVKWLDELPDSSDDFSEVQLARQLTSLTGLDWELVQQALATRRLAEQVATTTEAAEWLPGTIEQADELRRTGESILLQEIGQNRQSAAERLLTDAHTRYEAAARDVAALRDAARFRDVLLDLAPQVVAWRRASEVLPGPRSPTHADVMALLAATGELADTLDTPSPDKLTPVVEAVSRAETLLAVVQSGLEPGYIRDRLLAPPDPADDLLRMRALLETTLPAAADRVPLRESVQRAEESLVSRIPFDARATIAPVASIDERRRITERVELETRLATLTVHGGRGVPVDPVIAARDAILEGTAIGTVDSEGNVTAPAVALSHFQDALAEFWRGTVPAMADVSGWTTEIGGDRSKLRAADRALRLLDGRDSPQIARSPVELLQRATLSHVLDWQAHRIERDLRNMPADRTVVDVRHVESYRQSAADLLRREPNRRLPPRIVVDATNRISLETARTGVIELTVVNPFDKPADVWLSVDYDPTLVMIDAESAALFVPAWRLDQQQSGPSPGFVDPRFLNRPDRLGDTPPGLQLASGERRSINVTMQRLAGDGRPSRFVVRAIAVPVIDAAAEGEQQSEPAAVLSRKDVIVTLPSVAPARLVVEGPPGTVTGDAQHPVLSPFPNRFTPFRLLLAGRSDADADAVVDVALYPVRTDRFAFGALPPIDDLPTEVGVDPLTATDLLARWTDGIPLFTATELSLSADGPPVALPFPRPAPAAPGTLPPACEQGLLVVVTDRATGRQSLLPISFRPQHPRRYLEPFVRYDADAERIDITVQSRDDLLLPPGGSRVSCEIVDAIPPESTRRLEGTVTAGKPPATLFVETAGVRESSISLQLSVDGYPRAFLYRIPLDASREAVPFETGVAAIRVTSPPRGASYRSPLASVPITMEIDAPVGTRWDLGDAIEVGFDRDRDRELRGERTVALYSDRQFGVTIDRLGPGGEIAIGTTVDDFRIDLPADHLDRGRVNILAHLAAGDRAAWSNPVEIAVDDVAPALLRVRLGGRQVIVGEPLQVVAEATDGNLSGVAQVLVGVDLARTGEFSAEPAPIAAAREQGRWLAAIDTSALLPGPYYVLVRAVDAVGNAGPFARERFEVVTAEQRAAARAAAVNRVDGFVQYRGRPMGGFEVTLEPLPPKPVGGDVPAESAAPAEEAAAIAKPLPPVTTKSDGMFSIGGVPPGRYRATAAGVYTNRRRTGSVEIEVPPFPTELPPAEIEVDPRG